MHKLYPCNHLISQHQDSLQREFPSAITEQVLQTWSQQVNDENILFPVHTAPLDISNATSSLEGVVDLGLVEQLGMLRLAALDLHGDDLVGVHVRGEVDLAEGAAADLPAELELAADDAVHAPRRRVPVAVSATRTPTTSLPSRGGRVLEEEEEEALSAGLSAVLRLIFSYKTLLIQPKSAEISSSEHRAAGFYGTRISPYDLRTYDF